MTKSETSVLPLDGARKPRRLWRWVWPMATVAAFFSLFQIGFGVAPKTVLYFVADKMAASLLNENEASSSMPVITARRLAAIWLEQNVLAHVYSEQILPAGMDDAQQMGERLVKLRTKLVSQFEIPHPAPQAPAEIAGLSWCDGLNGVGAILLSHGFEHAEVVGLKGKGLGPGDGHSFGRVWSKQYQDWLYFDIWSGEVMVFRSKSGERAQYLFQRIPQGAVISPHVDNESLRWFHDRSYRAIPHNELQSTFAAYVWNRVWHYLDHGFTAPESMNLLAVQPDSLAAGSAKTSGQAINKTSMPRAYVRARLDALFGQTALARREYAAVAKSDAGTNSAYGKAAALFVQRIDAQASAQ
jgi:hypothetical protein